MVSQNKSKQITFGLILTVFVSACDWGGGYDMTREYQACVVSYFQDGPAATARFGNIAGLTTDSSGSIIIGDPYNRAIRSLKNGSVKTFATVESASEGIVDVTIDASGSIYFLNNAFVYTLSSAGQPIWVAGSENSFSGGFWQPWGLTIAPDGNVIVADSRNNRIKLVSPNGDITEMAGSGDADMAPIRKGGGFADGPGATAMFNRPASVACDAAGNVYVSDTVNHRIRMISPERVVTTVAGSGADGHQDGPGATAQFGDIRDITVAPDGTIYVVDLSNHLVRMVAPDGMVSTLPAFSPGAQPTSVATDASGSLLVSVFTDAGNARGGQILRLVQGKGYQVVAGELGACEWQTRIAR